MLEESVVRSVLPEEQRGIGEASHAEGGCELPSGWDLSDLLGPKHGCASRTAQCLSAGCGALAVKSASVRPAGLLSEGARLTLCC